MSEDIVLERPYLFLGSRLKRVAEQLQSDVILLSQAAGLPIQPGQYPLLATLDRYGPKTVGELARAMRITQPTVTRTVARLVKLDLIQVDHLHRDRRHKTISLTVAGRAAIAHSKIAIWPKVEAAIETVMSTLSGSLLQQIDGLEAHLAQGLVNEPARPILAQASEGDIPAVVELLNLAFRGSGPHASWNSEAQYMDGDRTSERGFRDELAGTPAAELLLFRPSSKALKGCVLLEPKADNLWVLSSLAVDPRDQNSGFGRRLLDAAEAWAQKRGAVVIQMTVVNVRDTLIAWYERRGYKRTGESHAFPYDDHRFGVPRRDDLCFIVLEKVLT